MDDVHLYDSLLCKFIVQPPITLETYCSSSCSPLSQFSRVPIADEIALRSLLSAAWLLSTSLLTSANQSDRQHWRTMSRGRESALRKCSRTEPLTLPCSEIQWIALILEMLKCRKTKLNRCHKFKLRGIALVSEDTCPCWFLWNLTAQIEW